MNNNNIVKSLDQLAKMFGKDRLITTGEIDKVLSGIVSLLATFKKETEELNADTKQTTEKLLNILLDKYENQNSSFRTLSEKQQQDFKDRVEEMVYLIQEFKKMKPKDGKDGVSPKLQDIIDGVLAQVKIPTPEQFVLHGEDIIDKINELDLNDENKIDWDRIKNIPQWLYERPVGNGGMSPTVLRQAVDLDHSTRADGYGIVWDEATKRHKYSASAGGGSGTVNSGTQYRLAYYATTGTAVSENSAITASRVLVSNANGLPTHSSVTTTTLGYLDATSSIQTQLDAKFTLPSLTAGSILFSNGTTIAQDNSNFFWDDTNDRFAVGTTAPEYTLHVKGSTSGGHALFERTTSATNSVAGALRLRATSSGDMADNFGVQLAFHIQDTANTDNQIAVITATRDGADNTGKLNFISNNAGSGSVGLSVGYNQNVSVGSSTITGSRLDITTTRSATNPSNIGVNICTRSGTFTDTSSTGTVALILGHGFYSNTFAASSATTYTDVANVYINGAPSAGTNVTITTGYALWVDAGTTRLDGATWFGATVLPFTNDGAALGTSSFSFSDLFLASGAVINFNNGDVTLTHSADTLTLGGGTLALGSNSLTMTGSIGATGARVTKGWFTDIESTNMPTVGGTAILTSLTAPQFTTIELGHATDTTLARSAAGQVTIEGVQVLTASNTVTLTNKRKQPRVYSATNNASLTPEIDTYDIFHLTAMSANTTINNKSTSTPADGEIMIFRFLDNGTSRTLTWGTDYVAKGGTALPSATTISKNLAVIFEWNANLSKWNLMSAALEA